MNPICRQDIERMAELSGLDVEPEALSTLTRQIAAIIEYVSQIGENETEDDSQLPERSSPDGFVRLRKDEPNAANSIVDAGAFAPAFEDGFFVVPRPESIADR